MKKKVFQKVFIKAEKKTKEVLITFETEMYKVCQKTHQYLEESSFWRDWRKISFTHWKDKKNLIKAFFVRFDGLETIRFFNYLGS